MSISTPTGDKYETYILKIIAASQPTVGDLLTAASNQVSRVQSRTVRGVDYQGRPFYPYANKKPYYVPTETGPNRARRQKQLASRTGGLAIKKTYGIRYDSYAAYRRATGHPTVDLGGMSGRLLSNIESRSGGQTLRHSTGYANRTISIDQYPTPATQFEYGIYSSPADEIAEGHNNGVPGKLPKRRFLDSSQSDIASMESDIAQRCEQRANKQAGN
jgi:hypothetical protein